MINSLSTMQQDNVYHIAQNYSVRWKLSMQVAYIQ